MALRPWTLNANCDLDSVSFPNSSAKLPESLPFTAYVLILACSACKSQILKCMECGSSHDTLQQLTTHMMVTGHFLKVTSSASKKGKQLVLDPLAVEKMQSLSDAPNSDALAPKPSSNSASDAAVSSMELKKDSTEHRISGPALLL